MSEEAAEAEVDVTDELVELIDDQLTMYTGEDGNQELAWFITSAIQDEFMITRTVDPVESNMVIYFSTQGLEDLFLYCREHNLKMHTFVRDTLKNAIY